MFLHILANLKSAACCCTAARMSTRETSDCASLLYFHETKLCFLMLILFVVFRYCDETPLHCSAYEGKLEVCRLLVESKAYVAARSRCRSPSRARHDLLTRVTGTAKLLSKAPSTGTRLTLPHIFAVSARRNDALAAPHPPCDQLAYSKPLPALLLPPALFVAAAAAAGMIYTPPLKTRHTPLPTHPPFPPHLQSHRLGRPLVRRVIQHIYRALRLASANNAGCSEHLPRSHG
jgi:hypothetical protein